MKHDHACGWRNGAAELKLAVEGGENREKRDIIKHAAGGTELHELKLVVEGGENREKKGTELGLCNN